jgi:N-hydroxyarylamine O-acetyltransferase
LGFTVTLFSARVRRRDGSEGPEFDHLTLRVDLEESWLADVGFGDFILDPLHLRVGFEQKQDSGVFRIVGQEGDLRVEKLQVDGSWTEQYRFALQPRRLEEFAAMCHYHQTSPESHFTRNSVCSLATVQGRITVTDRKLIETNNGLRQERVLTSDEEWKQVLVDRFSVRLPELHGHQRGLKNISASERRM